MSTASPVKMELSHSASDAKCPSHGEPKRVSILGSTGSIGENTVDLLLQHPGRYQVIALSAHNNVERLIAQAKQLQPECVAIGNDSHYAQLKDALANEPIEVIAGDHALEDAASRPADWVMAAIVGTAGLKPLLQAIKTGATVAFANKECLVCAGELLIKACRLHGATLLPVDSEHNAIFQVFDFDHPERVSRLILTASGGPFRQTPADQLAHVTVEQAVAHPNWRMGAKISVDSATMMNKALEMIEAYHLFPVHADQIEAIIHPESIIHSIVQYCDGSMLTQMGVPDMRIPIAHTLAWPDRLPTNAEALDLASIGQLNFQPPDPQRFPALDLSQEVMRSKQSLAIAMNAANEVAVDAFLCGKIGFMQITETVEKTMRRVDPADVTSLEDALYLDAEYRLDATRIMRGLAT